MRFFLLLFASLGLINIASSQSTISISGYLKDSLTGERLIGANIYDPISLKGTSSNSFGYYVLKLNKQGIIKLQYSYVGYKPHQISFNTNGDTIISVSLVSNNSLDQVIVKGEKSREELTEISKITLLPAQVKKLPSFTGEPDLLKVCQLMPGINQGTEGTSGLYVRGGSPDQNLFLLDDVPLYNVMHLGGLYSVFDPSALKSVDLYKGGFPARYGGRISSIIDIRNNDGNIKQYNSEIGLSLLLSKLFIEGPLKKGKASFLFSIRRSNLDLYTFLFNKVLSGSSDNIAYYFYDVNLKLNYIINDRNRVFLAFYKGIDNFYHKYNESQYTSGFDYKGYSGIKWGNTALSSRWQHIFANQVTNNLTVASTFYKYENKNNFKAFNKEQNLGSSSDFNLTSNIQDIIIKSDLQIPTTTNDIKLGIEGACHTFNPSAIHYSYSTSDTLVTNPTNENEIEAYSGAIYAERIFNLTEKISTNIGFRFNFFQTESTSFLSPESRFILNYRFLPSWALKASYCNMSQNIHLLTNSGAGLPSDLWVPSTKQAHPEKSNQFTLGLTHTTLNNYNLSIEAYYKTLTNLIEYKEGILVYSSNESWEEKVEKNGKGYAEGIELMIEKQYGRLTGWLSYTLSKSERSFRNIQDGAYFPFKYDQRHNFNIVISFAISEKLSASAVWQYHTGNGITLAQGKYEILTQNYFNNGKQYMEEVHIYSKRNAYCMPAYHKLDLGLNYIKIKRRGTAIWNIGIFNAYNHQNAYFLFFKEKNGTTKLYQQSLFPIIFNFGYTFKFQI
jgi:hypothetical protein